MPKLRKSSTTFVTHSLDRTKSADKKVMAYRQDPVICLGASA